MYELKANELRIGNLLFEEYGGIYEVEGITGCGNVEMKKGGMTATGFYSISRLTPTPLTEEWLIKFGFNPTKESESVNWVTFNNFDIAIHEEQGDVYIVYNHIVLKHVKYVHQLQNLFYSITNIELQQTNN